MEKARHGSGRNPASASTDANSAAVTRSRAKSWAFRIAAATLVPAVLLALLEGGLRLSGFGYDAAYFARIDGQEAVFGNPTFGWRFFPPAIARRPPPIHMPLRKPPGTVRIFVLGSSAAQGFPDPAFSFARVLEVMLQDAYPHVAFEVINTAMVAINSHVVREIAADCASYEPDLFILYEGNNEVVGPFGAGTVFDAFTDNLPMIRARLWLQTTRIGQLAARLGGSLRPRGSTQDLTVWKGMEFFLEQRVPADSPALAGVYDHFRENVRAIAASARRAGAPLLLCTVGVNLKDCAPFAAVRGRGGDEWEARYAEGQRREEAGDAAGAIESYQAACLLDDRYADAFYRLGRCALQLGEVAAARQAFSRARDLDTLRFRTDSRLNAILRELGGSLGAGVRLVDIERLFEDAGVNPAGIAGIEHFYEHVHMNFDGNYEIARALFAEVVALLGQRLRGDTAGAPEPLSRDACANRLAYCGLARHEIAKQVASLLEHPPFTNQLDHAHRLAAARAAARATLPETTPTALAQQRTSFEEALGRRPRDPYLNRAYAGLLAKLSDWERAIQRARDALAITPFDAGLRVELGGFLAMSGDAGEATREYLRVCDDVYADASARADALFGLGVLADRRRSAEEAVRRYNEAIACNPTHVKAMTNLGLLYRRQGQPSLAESRFREVVKHSPDLMLGHFNLALALIDQQKTDEAMASLRRAAEIEPNNPSVRLTIGSLLIQAGRFGEAIEHLEIATKNAPNSPDAWFALGGALWKTDRRSEAEAAFRRTLELKPDHASARQALEKLHEPAPASP